MRLLPFILVFLSAPALAQEATTSAGPVEILRPDDGRASLRIGGKPVALPGRPWSLHIVEQRGDNLLVALQDAEDGWCRSLFAWVEATPGALSASDMFGSCAWPDEISEAPGGGLRVVMASETPGGGLIAFDWAGGKAVSEVALGLAPSGQAPGDGPDFWLDRYPYDLATAADYQDRLTSLIGAENMQALWTNTSLGTPFEAAGDWVVGEGCEKYACPDEAAAIALSPDGALVVALRRGGNTAVFGETPARPGALTGFLAGDMLGD